MTPFVTVLIPTHDHARLIPYAIQSAVRQNFGNIEIFVIGDGAGSQTKEIVESLSRNDRRIRYFDFPKGQRHGELSRHTALQEARGKIVAYLSDDDLWLPDHLDNLVAGLADADFAHTLHTAVQLNGAFSVNAIDLTDYDYPLAMMTSKTNYFGLTVVGHTMAAYRALPFGWCPAPDGLWTDLHMWRQFLAQPRLRIRTIPICDSLHLATPMRLHMTTDERENEIREISERLSRADGGEWYRQQVSIALAARLNEQRAAQRSFRFSVGMLAKTIFPKRVVSFIGSIFK